MSKMEIAAVLLEPLYTIWLILATSHENKVWYKAFANASLASRDWSIVKGV